MKFLLSLMMMVALALGSVDAEAKRLGGGKSLGQQSSNVSQRQATPPAATPNATPSAAPNPGMATAPARSRWGGMLGGLAAGLGLAWLASTLGFGEELAQFMLFGLLAAAIMVVVGMVMRARAAKAAQGMAAPSPFAFGTAGAGSSAAAPMTPRSYSPEHIGNDASARPWERNSMAFDPRQAAAAGAGGSMIGSALSGSQGWGVPADFDVQGFVTAAKRNFINLQDAWDRSDIPSLRAMMTDSMLTEIKAQLAEREQQAQGQVNKTEVLHLEARLLGIEELNDSYMASVEFDGMIREDISSGPSPFREVWNMTKPKAGGGWLVAGVQALQ